MATSAPSTPSTPPAQTPGGRPLRTPVRVSGQLDAPLNRWLWLVKWLLAIPHYLILIGLWVAFAVLSVAAFFAIVVTGRYPRRIFDFNVGVLRWSWRVSFYAYDALGTDRYPPFTLNDVPDYPARLEVDYPERLSRGLVLVKWWLLAIPHYLIVGIFVGGGLAVTAGGDQAWSGAWGLISLLVLIAAVALLFTASYPRAMFDLIVGLNRWVYRVVGYAALMTDQYPPFRLDQGGPDPAGLETVPTSHPDADPDGLPRHPLWTTGRLITAVGGSLALLASSGLLVAGAALLVVDQTQRDADGYLMSNRDDYSTTTSALVSEPVDLPAADGDWTPESVLGDAKLEVDSTTEVFVGVAPTDELTEYLAGFDHEEVSFAGEHRSIRVVDATDPAAGSPESQTFWIDSSVGSGNQSLTWPAEGSWTAVVMNPDGSPEVEASIRVGATAPGLTGLIVGLFVAGGVLAGLGILAILLAVPRRPRAAAGQNDPGRAER